jgi:hypothetical protein
MRIKVIADHFNQSFEVYTPYKAEYVADVKKHVEGKWDSLKKCWTVPFYYDDVLFELLLRHYQWHPTPAEKRDLTLQRVNPDHYAHARKTTSFASLTEESPSPTGQEDLLKSLKSLYEQCFKQGVSTETLLSVMLDAGYEP